MSNRAYTKFWEAETITNADAIAFLETVPIDKLTGMSVVNPQFTKLQVFNIFMEGARDGKPDATLFPTSFRNMQKEYKKLK